MARLSPTNSGGEARDSGVGWVPGPGALPIEDGWEGQNGFLPLKDSYTSTGVAEFEPTQGFPTLGSGKFVEVGLTS